MAILNMSRFWNIGASPSISTVFNQGLTPIPLETVIGRNEGTARWIETRLPACAHSWPDCRRVRAVGRVRSVDGTVIWVRGLAHLACIGDRVRLLRGTGEPLGGEVLRIREDLRACCPMPGSTASSQGDRVAVLGPPTLAPSDSWIGRVDRPLRRASRRPAACRRAQTARVPRRTAAGRTASGARDAA